MISDPSVAPLSFAQLDALGLAGFDESCAELAPPLPVEQIAQGRAVTTLAVATLTLAELAAHPATQFAELGLPRLSEVGWTVEREQSHPFLLYVWRSDGASIQPAAQLAAERCLDLGEKGQLLDLRGRRQPLALRSGAHGLVIQVGDDMARSFHAVLQPLTVAPMPVLQPPLMQWLSPSDTWLTAHLTASGASTDPAHSLAAAAMTYRWRDGPGFVAEVPGAVKWVRVLDPQLVVRLERVLTTRVEQLADQLKALADDPSADPAWRAAMDRQFAERASLEGSRRLLGQNGDLPVLDAALMSVDRLGRLLVAALPPWPATDPELARRAWLADPDAWWSQHEAERAEALDHFEDDDA